jgi:hypothetical protein
MEKGGRCGIGGRKRPKRRQANQPRKQQTTDFPVSHGIAPHKDIRICLRSSSPGESLSVKPIIYLFFVNVSVDKRLSISMARYSPIPTTDVWQGDS